MIWTTYWRLSVAFLLALFVSHAANANSRQQADAIVLQGEQAPGFEPGVIFSEVLNAIHLNANGQVAFNGLATLGGEINFTNRRGIWQGTPGHLQLIARGGEQASGFAPGVEYADFDSGITLSLNATGQLAFSGGIAGSGFDETNSRVVWSNPSGTLTPVARQGGQAPGVADGLLFDGFTQLEFNDLGQTAFLANLRDTAAGGSFHSYGIWSEAAGVLSLVARTGDHAPGTAEGVYFRDFGSSDDFEAFAFNKLGQTAFLGHLAGDEIDTSNDSGIWTERDGSLSLLVREGDPAIGTGTGVEFNRLGEPTFNSAGTVTFAGAVTGPNIDDLNDTGIWVTNGDSLSLIVREGDHVPGAPAEVQFGPFSKGNHQFHSPTMNSAGDIAFTAPLIGNGIDSLDGSGIWTISDGTLSTVARTGQQAPGTPEGVLFALGFDPPVINSLGQVAFRGFLTGEGVTSSNNIGIWAQDDHGGLQLIARWGDSLALDSGQVLTQGPPGSPWINARGEIAFHSGPNGILSYAAAVPEPATNSVMLAGLVMLTVWSSRLKHITLGM